MRSCENEGTSVGGTRCLNDATHRVTFWQDQDEYETFLCPECFTGFREEMIKSGLKPRNEETPMKGYAPPEEK